MRVSGLSSWLRFRDNTRRRRRAKLRFESLEKRSLLATLITVNSVDDVPAEDSLVTLREALAFANGDFGLDEFTPKKRSQVQEGVTGDFDVIIQLEQREYFVDATRGPLVISKSVSIQGVGQTTISPRDQDSSLANSNLFVVKSTANARLSNLKLENARALSLDPSEEFATHGAAIYNRGTLAVESVQLSNNHSFVGGAIANDVGGNLTMVNSSITDSVAGSITSFLFPTLVIPMGGGFFNEGKATVINSTISGNRTTVNPFLSSAEGTQNAGSGIHNVGDLTVINSTIANNIGLGGGISSPNVNTDPLPRLYNTIVVNNSLSFSDATLNDVSGFFNTDSTNSVISQPGATPAGLVTGKNILRAFVFPGDEFEPDDVIDLTLRDNGGPMQTHALKPGSLAIDGGSNIHATTLGADGVPGTGDANETQLVFEQRGLGRIFGGTVDIGAVEFFPDEILVDSLADGIDGDLSGNQLTLREAIEITNVNPNSKSIRVVAEGTVTLTEGELLLNYKNANEARIIRGPGRSQFIIDADAKSRLINAPNIGQQVGQSLTIENLTLTNGKANNAAGLFVGTSGPNSITNLKNVKLSHSSSNAANVVFADSLNLIDSEITQNTVATAIDLPLSATVVEAGILYISGSILQDNRITSRDKGNAILGSRGDVTVVNSTFVHNGSSDGAASLLVGEKNVLIDSSTFVGNRSGQTTLNIVPKLMNAPIVQFRPPGDAKPKPVSLLTVTNSLFADNFQQEEFIGRGGNESISQSLLVLGDHGGPTETFSVSGEASIVGKIVDRKADAVDQRGFARGPNSTAGAFEPALTVNGFFPTSTILVTTLVDEDNGTANPVVGSGTSLREAISLANSVNFITTIEFAPSVVGEMDLTLGELSITSLIGLNILGPGADLLTIDAGGLGRILHVRENSTAQISGLKLTGGNLTGFEGGGAIRNQGTAILQRLEITNNSAIDGAGGLANLGTATLDQVSIHGNTSSFGGGGIGNAGDLTVRNSTIARNSAAVFGGGIDNVGTALIVNSTIAGNTASTGGGVLTDENEANANTRIVNSIVIGNSAFGTPNDLGGKAVQSDSINNLIGDSNSAGGLTGGNNGNIVGASLANVLQTNGDEVVLVARGGTSSISVLPGSVAVDAGDTASANSLGADVSSSIDQDQSRRPRVVGGAVDIGALELSLTLVAPQVSNSATPTLAVMTEAGVFTSGQEVMIDIDLNNDGDFLDTDEAGATSTTLEPASGNAALPSLANGVVNVRARIVGGAGPDTISATQTITINTALAGNTFVAAPNTVATVLSELSSDGDTLLLRGGDYSGQTVTKSTKFKPFGDGPVMIRGASPALTVTGGQVLVEDGITLTNDTDTPTVVAQNGSMLILRATTILESSTGNQPAILAEPGAQVDLGFDNTPGNNTIVIRGEGTFIDNQSTQLVKAIGNTLKRDDIELTDGFEIEDLTNHALDDAALGLVMWEDKTVFVTEESGSITRGVDAVPDGGLVNIQSGRYEENVDASGRGVALSFGSESGRQVTIKGNVVLDGSNALLFEASGLDPISQHSNLVVEDGSITAGPIGDSALVIFNLNFDAVPDDAFTIIHADQGFVGEFEVTLGFDGHLPLEANQTTTGAAAQLVVTTLVPEVSLEVSESSVGEAGGTSNITAILSAATNVDVTIELSFVGSAVENEDFSVDTRTIVIPAGGTSGSVTFTAIQDELDEDDESVSIVVEGVTNATDVDLQSVDITIVDDDESPTVTLTTDPASIAEDGGTSTVTATLSAVSGRDITIEFEISGSASAGDDYAPLSTSLVIAAGQTVGTMTVTAVNDELNEANETIVIDISGVTNATEDNEQQAIVTITDDDAVPTLSVSDVTVIEGDSGTVNAIFTVTLSRASGQVVTVDFATASDSATQTADYASSSGTLTFEPGEASRTITVAVVSDVLDESDETFSVNLSDPVNSTIEDGTAIGTITDDDAPPTVTLSRDNATIAEAAGTSIITATLSAASSFPVTIELDFTGTATLATDYTRTATQIVIAAGETTGSVTLTAIEDTLDEADETIIVEIDGVTNATEATAQQVTVTVTDNDASPTLSIGDMTVTEGINGSADAIFTVTLSTASAQIVTVDFATADATAIQPADYEPNSGTLTFAPGETSKSITVVVAGDELDEVDETFSVNLTASVNATIEDGTAIGTITDDDAPPTVTLSRDNATIAEAAGTSIITATLSAASSLPVTIDLDFTGTATLTSDYTRTATQIVIVAGETTGSITLTAVEDTLDEADETIVVEIAGITNATEATAQQVTVTVTDNDASPTLSIGDMTVTEGSNGTADAVFTVTLSTSSALEVKVDFATADATAIQPSDYAPNSGTLTFAPGETSKTITVVVAGDELDEVDETYNVNLTDPVNATIEDGTAIGTITDDDAPPTVTLSRDNATIAEAAGTSIITATLSAASSLPVTIDLDFTGTATLTSDYTRTATQIVIAAGETTGSVTLTAAQDTLDEADETIVVEIAGITNATEATAQQVTVTVTDNDASPTLSIGDMTVTEGSNGTADAVFTVTLSTSSALEVKVDFATADATAIQPSDYAPNSGTLTFAPGETSKTITVVVAGDELDEVDETFSVNLTAPVNATIEDGTAIGTITDDDAPPTVTLSRDSATIAEAAGTSIITAMLSAASSLPVTIDLDFTGTATLTSDYTRTATQIVIAAGETTGSVTLTAAEDTLDEADETIVVEIAGITNATEATAQQVTVTIVDNDTTLPQLDFGDAPSRYPVTLAQNGARHTTGTLFLGTGVDVEADGQPSTLADADIDDGVSLIASLYKVDGAVSRSSFRVVASQAAKLDGWIDFNADGDWDDAGEQIFTSVDVAAGANILTFSVPASATVGDTAARFRLSTAGTLAPTGAASDGEVEDYLHTVIDGDSNAGVTVTIINVTIRLTLDNNENVVRSGATELFRALASSINALQVNGTASDDTITIDLASGFTVPTAGIDIDGGGGTNTLMVEGAGNLDLTDPNSSFDNLSTIVLPNDSFNRLTLDRNAVNSLSPTTKTLRITSGLGDVIEVESPNEWRLGAPKTEGGKFVLTARHQQTGGETIEVDGGRAFRNFLQVGDVDNSGLVTAGDALAVIFELNQRSFSAANGDLADPASIANWPGIYYDANGDGRVTAADALNVLNILFLQSLAGGEGESAQQPSINQPALVPNVSVTETEPGEESIVLAPPKAVQTPKPQAQSTAISSQVPAINLIDHIMREWDEDDANEVERRALDNGLDTSVHAKATQ